MRILTLVLLSSIVPQSIAGKYIVSGSNYAWNNNFNDNVGALTLRYVSSAGLRTFMGIKINAPYDKLWGYPAICRGMHYSFNPTSDLALPRMISTLHNLKGYFNYVATGINMHGDFTYDLFMRHDANPGPPELEIMIWGKHNSWPIGVITERNIIFQKHSYDLWEGKSSGGYYTYSFVPSGTVGIKVAYPMKGSTNVDVIDFLNWLGRNRQITGRYKKDLYLDVIEAGYEVVKGYGNITLSALFIIN